VAKSKLSVVGGNYVLTAPIEGNESLRKVSGVNESNGVFSKNFPRGRFISTKKAITDAVARHREGVDVVVSGMSGYSELGAERCTALNIQPGRYESLASSLLISSLRAQKREIRGINARLVYGSSGVGVDLVTQNVAAKEGIPLLGFTCPEYLWWVSNESVGPTICICRDEAEYCKQYVGALDILFAANGGEVSFNMDLLAATRMHKRVIGLNVLQTLGANTPAYTPEGKVADAIGALNYGLSIIDLGSVVVTRSPDPFPAIKQRFCETVVGITRGLVSGSRAYPTEDSN